MKNILLIIALFSCVISTNAQVRPDQAIEKTTAQDTDEIYSQYNGLLRRIKFSTAKTYFQQGVVDSIALVQDSIIVVFKSGVETHRDTIAGVGVGDSGTDDQTLSFVGTTLSIEDGNSVDLSSLQDGTGTDDQTIDVLSLAGTTLSLSLENDGQAAQTVDLSSLQDGTGTDDQTAAEVSFSPTGNILSSNVQSVGEEIQTQIDAIQTTSGVVNGATNLGTFTGSTITDNTTVKAALQTLETEIESLGGGGGSPGVSSFEGRTGVVTLQDSDVYESGSANTDKVIYLTSTANFTLANASTDDRRTIINQAGGIVRLSGANAGQKIATHTNFYLQDNTSVTLQFISSGWRVVSTSQVYSDVFTDKARESHHPFLGAIKSVNITEGVNSTDSIFIGGFYYTSGGNTEIIISKLTNPTTKQDIARFRSNPYTPSEDIETLTLSELNSSGVVGTMTIQWSRVQSGIGQGVDATSFTQTQLSTVMVFDPNQTTINNFESRVTTLETISGKNLNVFDSIATVVNAKEILDLKIFSANPNDSLYIRAIGYDTPNNRFNFLISKYSDNSDFLKGDITNWDVWIGDKDSYITIDLVPVGSNPVNYSGYIKLKPSAFSTKQDFFSNKDGSLIASKNILQSVDPRVKEGHQLVIENSMLLTKDDVRYAHEASVHNSNKNIFVTWVENTTSQSESANGQAAYFLSINKLTKDSTLVELAVPGKTYGTLTIPSNTYVTIPQIYDINGNIRAFFSTGGRTYYRDFNEANNTFNDPTEFTATIHGGVSAVQLTAANIKAHCEAITGTTNTDFNNLTFVLRNENALKDIGNDTLYLTGEFVDDIAGYTIAYPVFMKSDDNGLTWTLKGFPQETSGTTRYLESTTFYDYDLSTWYMFLRDVDDFKIVTSTDNGLTWGDEFDGYFHSAQAGYRTAGLDFQLDDNSLRRYIFAYNYSYSLFSSNTSTRLRSVLAIALGTKIQNMENILFVKHANTIHYPCFSLDKRHGKLYMVYTTDDNRDNVSTGGLKSAIRLCEISLSSIF
jgi:hypothetical protein